MELKPWVRRVVAGWVFVLVPVLAVNLGWFVLAAPRIAATSWDSAARFVGQVPSGGLTAAFAVVQLVLLLLPTVGLTYTLLRTGRRAAAGAWRWSAGSVARRTGVVAGSAVLAALLALAWWPDGRMAPYREGERATVQESVTGLRTVGSGRPLLRSPADAQDPLAPVTHGTSARTGTVDEPRAGQQDAPSSSPPSSDADGSAVPRTPAPSGSPEQPTGQVTAAPTADATDPPTGEPTVSAEPSADGAPVETPEADDQPDEDAVPETPAPVAPAAQEPSPNG